MSNSNTSTNNHRATTADDAERTSVRGSSTVEAAPDPDASAHAAIDDVPLPSTSQPSLGAGRPPPSFQLHTEYTEYHAITAVLNEADSQGGRLAPARPRPHRHAKPIEAIPALDTFKRSWYKDWFSDRSVEKTDPFGFSSEGTSNAASRNISRAPSPAPAMAGNYATARRDSLKHQAATGQVIL